MLTNRSTVRTERAQRNASASAVRRGGVLCRAIPVIECRGRNPPLLKKFHNKEANDFALPADARATRPVHRAHAGGNVDVACETDLSALDDRVVVETDGCADLFAKAPTLVELPVSKVVWEGSTAGESLMILLLVVAGIIA